MGQNGFQVNKNRLAGHGYSGPAIQFRVNITTHRTHGPHVAHGQHATEVRHKVRSNQSMCLQIPERLGIRKRSSQGCKQTSAPMPASHREREGTRQVVQAKDLKGQPPEGKKANCQAGSDQHLPDEVQAAKKSERNRTKLGENLVRGEKQEAHPSNLSWPLAATGHPKANKSAKELVELHKYKDLTKSELTSRLRSASPGGSASNMEACRGPMQPDCTMK